MAKYDVLIWLYEEDDFFLRSNSRHQHDIPLLRIRPHQVLTSNIFSNQDSTLRTDKYFSPLAF